MENPKPLRGQYGFLDDLFVVQNTGVKKLVKN